MTSSLTDAVPTGPDATELGHDTWYEVHDRYLETLLHWAVLLVADGSTAPTQRPEVLRHGERARDLADELVGLGTPAPLERLAALGGLTPTEHEVLVLALATELDPTVGSALGDRTGSRELTAEAVGLLFDLPPSECAAIGDPSSALRRFGIVADPSPRSPGPLVRRPIRLTDRVIGHVLARGAIDDRLRGLVEPIEPVPIPDRHTAIAHDLAGWLTSPDRPAGPAQVELVGPTGVGRAAVAAHVASDVGLQLLRLDLDRLAGRPDRLELVPLIGRELLLLPAALYVEDPSGGADDPARRASIDESIDSIDGLVFVGTDRASRERSTSVVLPKMTSADRAELWRHAVPEATGPDLDLVADQFRFGPRSVARVASDARFRAELGRRRIAGTDVRAACRATAGVGLARLAERVDSRVGWDRLVVGPQEREILGALCGHVRHRRLVLDEWGLAGSTARGLGTSALFTGPSGTGKTLAAEVIATELDLDLYRIDLASVVSKFIGETEKNLRSVFDAAEQGGAILFFDEADALFGKRTEVKDSHDRYANIEINYLLQRMEAHAGLSILATNRKGDLDQAFLRRIRFVVPFPFPREPARLDIWRTELSAGMPVDDVDLDALARLELAGGNIRNVVVNATFRAAERSSAVGMDDLMRAAALEYQKLDKLPTRAELGPWYEEIVR